MVASLVAVALAVAVGARRARPTVDRALLVGGTVAGLLAVVLAVLGR